MCNVSGEQYTYYEVKKNKQTSDDVCMSVQWSALQRTPQYQRLEEVLRSCQRNTRHQTVTDVAAGLKNKKTSVLYDTAIKSKTASVLWSHIMFSRNNMWP